MGLFSAQLILVSTAGGVRYGLWAVPHSLIELVLFDHHAEEGAEIGDSANDGLGFSGIMPEIDESTEEEIDDGDYCRRQG